MSSYSDEMSDAAWCHRVAAEVVAWPGGGPTAAVSGRHGQLDTRIGRMDAVFRRPAAL